MNCWFVPEVGDCVAIHEPGEASEHITRGERGIVQEIEGEGSPYARYLVLVKNERGTWLEKFMRWQIQAAIFDTDATLVVPLGAGNKSSSESEG